MLTARINTALRSSAAKPLLLLLGLAPALILFVLALQNQLGANPTEKLTRETGEWALRFLILALAVTPLRVSLGLTMLLRLRRMLGLLSFFYALLHFLCFAWFDMGFELDAIIRDIGKRPFILVGFLALLTMLPLASTSFNAAVKRLGAARWQHREPQAHP